MLDRFLAFFRDGNAAAVTQGKVFLTPGDASGIGDRTAQGAAASDAPNSFGGVRLLPPEHAATGAAAPFEAPTPDLFLSNSSGVSASEGFSTELIMLKAKHDALSRDLQKAYIGDRRKVAGILAELNKVVCERLKLEVRAGYAAPLSE